MATSDVSAPVAPVAPCPSLCNDRPCSNCAPPHPCQCVDRPCSNCPPPHPCQCIDRPCSNCVPPPPCHPSTHIDCYDRPPCQHNNCGCIDCKPSCTGCSCTNTCETITTIELIENCPAYDASVQNDETHWIATNHTIHSIYNITVGEREQQRVHEIELRHKNCDNAKYFTPSNVTELKRPTSTTSRKIGEILTNFANNHSDKPTQICTIVSGWTCRKQGLHFHPTSCQKYIECDSCGRNNVFLCPHDEAFNGRRCSSDWSECDRLPICEYDRESIIDPWNVAGYFMCVRKRPFNDRFFVFRRHCPNGEVFDSYKMTCYRKYYNNRPKPPTCKRGCVLYSGACGDEW